MAAPNIVNVSTITAKTVGAALGTSLTTDILANAASSGKVFKINTIVLLFPPIALLYCLIKTALST